MSNVDYAENAEGMYWVKTGADGEEVRGEPQKDLRAAMDDHDRYEREQAHNGIQNAEPTGVFGENRPDGSDSEEAHTDTAEGGAGGSEGVYEDSEAEGDPEGDPDSAGEGDPEE